MKFLVASLFLIILGAGVQSFEDDLSDMIFKKYAMLKVFFFFFHSNQII